MGVLMGGEKTVEAQESDWQEIPLPSGIHFYDLVFLDENAGWAVGQKDQTNGVLFHTTDGGKTWSEQSSGVAGAILTNFTWVDPMNGFIIGFDQAGKSFLMRTSDGGQTWQVITPANITGQIFSLTIQPGGVLWMLTVIYQPRSYHVWNSADGTSWSEHTVTPLPDARIVEITFPTVQVGYAVGRSGSDVSIPLLTKTSDGGETWANVSLPLAKGVLAGLFFIDDLNGFVCGTSENFGIILKTGDGGASWKEVARLSGSELTIDDVIMSNPLTGFAYGFWKDGDKYGMTVFQTKDGGNIWEKTSLPVASKITPPTIVEDTVWTAIYHEDGGDSALYFKPLPPYSPPQPLVQPPSQTQPPAQPPAAPPALTRIELDPRNIILTVGQPITFTATGYDQWGVVIDLEDPTWKINSQEQSQCQGNNSCTITPTNPGEMNLSIISRNSIVVGEFQLEIIEVRETPCGGVPLFPDYAISLLAFTIGAVYFIQRKISPPKN